MCFSMLYSKLYILTELNAYDVNNVISIDIEKLDLSKDIYLWYRKFYICSDTTQFYVHYPPPPPYVYQCTDINDICFSCVLSLRYDVTAFHCFLCLDLKFYFLSFVKYVAFISK